MLTLYGNAFSPFARKVQPILEHEGIDHDGNLALSRCRNERLLSRYGIQGLGSSHRSVGLCESRLRDLLVEPVG